MDIFTDTTRDLPTTRMVGVADNDFVVKQKIEDQYGYWWVSRQRGQVPAELSGAYTSALAATEAVKSHLLKHPLPTPATKKQ
jgi:hypothetical protein